ncbi:MAG: 50S ribosomal protein L13 [Thaumarchaeota archaeon 13_1_20CM_2_39_11]|nr:MAG: 50S ribosomal protein L13 [Thaumarchaeota archaeon 13_1_40CM_2_39_13_1]OLE43908.1 MAG: 50S ribosomal protein L13 [Thaumarchaeota archaeon 13_1_20CM_2_39_11]
MAKQQVQVKSAEKNPSSQNIIIDGTNQVAGRLCSHVAKLLINGNRVSIVNSENIMLSGDRKAIIEEYRKYLEIASITNPKFGPFHPRRPDTMISKMVRGMLPKNKPSGKTALKRLRAYLGVPNELKSKKTTQFEDAKIKKPAPYYTSLADLGRMVGWHE